MRNKIAKVEKVFIHRLIETMVETKDILTTTISDLM
jgi:hypothetical protein